MLKNKLANFIAKRVLVCGALLSVIDLIWIEQRWYALAGLIAGSIFCIVKFGSYSWIFGKIIAAATGNQKGNPVKTSTIGFLVNQAIVFPILLAAYYIHIWFFTGFIAGVLLLPLIIIVNCVTEVVGLTRNNFE